MGRHSAMVTDKMATIRARLSALRAHMARRTTGFWPPNRNKKNKTEDLTRARTGKYRLCTTYVQMRTVRKSSRVWGGTSFRSIPTWAVLMSASVSLRTRDWVHSRLHTKVRSNSQTDREELTSVNIGAHLTKDREMMRTMERHASKSSSPHVVSSVSCQPL